MFENLSGLAQNAAKSFGGDEQKAEGGDKPAAAAGGEGWGEVGDAAKKAAAGFQERNAEGKTPDYAALGDLGKKAAAAYNADPNKGNAQAVGQNIFKGLMSGGSKAEAEAPAETAPPDAKPVEEQKPEGEQPPPEQ